MQFVVGEVFGGIDARDFVLLLLEISVAVVIGISQTMNDGCIGAVVADGTAGEHLARVIVIGCTVLHSEIIGAVGANAVV